MLQTTLVQIHKWKMTNQILNLNAEKYYRKKKKPNKMFLLQFMEQHQIYFV